MTGLEMTTMFLKQIKNAETLTELNKIFDEISFCNMITNLTYDMLSYSIELKSEIIMLKEGIKV